MRPKFRAWDKEKNKMFEPTYRAYAGELEDLLISLKGDLILRKIDETIHESLFPNRFILMQSTGLLDKNGVEIYEGDILEVEKNEDGTYKGTINGNTFFGRFQGYSSKIKVDGMHDIYTLRNWNNHVRIIGNIYENPELKEQNK